MDMRNILKTHTNNQIVYLKNTHKIKKKGGGTIMLKLLAKIAEKYARSTNTASYIFVSWHQPKMPASLIKKD